MVPQSLDVFGNVGETPINQTLPYIYIYIYIYIYLWATASAADLSDSMTGCLEVWMLPASAGKRDSVVQNYCCLVVIFRSWSSLLVPFGSFWMPWGTLWVPSGSLLGSLVSTLLLLAHFGCLGAHCGCLLGHFWGHWCPL